MIVPSEAIVFNRNGLSVVVVEDGVAHIRPVTVVRDFGTTVEVSAGVKDGDQVILNPPVDFTDGQKVQLKPQVLLRSSHKVRQRFQPGNASLHSLASTEPAAASPLTVAPSGEDVEASECRLAFPG